MKKNKSKYITITASAILLIIGIAAFQFHTKKNQEAVAKKNTPKAHKEIKNNPTISEIKTAKVTRQSSNPKKVKIAKNDKKIRLPNGREIPEDFKNFPIKKGIKSNHFPASERVSIKDSKLALVKGLWAGREIDGIIPIKVINGLYFYNKAEVSGANNVIYDSAEQRYKAWTGELVAKGSAEVILEISNQYDLSIIEQSEGRAILKAGEGFVSERDLSELLSLTDISIELDLQSGRLRQM